mmetsp:Transcript_50717/g.158869  ORF Transcript_50717/g.158869 Transcript_50717/m.158869 type:complete len:200 (-) Transcript_50717:1044-1643(-)
MHASLKADWRAWACPVQLKQALSRPRTGAPFASAAPEARLRGRLPPEHGVLERGRAESGGVGAALPGPESALSRQPMSATLLRSLSSCMSSAEDARSLCRTIQRTLLRWPKHLETSPEAPSAPSIRSPAAFASASEAARSLRRWRSSASMSCRRCLRTSSTCLWESPSVSSSRTMLALASSINSRKAFRDCRTSWSSCR